MAQDKENDNNKWYLLNRLKTIVKKVTFLMNHRPNINQWRVVSSLTGGGVGSPGRSFRRRRQLSFGEKLGLTAIVSSDDEEYDDEDDDDDDDSLEVSSSSSSSRELKKMKSLRVERTTSFREEDDVDKRAEMFIQNFYRHLRYEKQVSLQIRNNTISFGSSSSNYNSNSPS